VRGCDAVAIYEKPCAETDEMRIFRFQIGMTFYVHANFGYLENMN
jgi:hypothetical protein